MAFTFLWNGSKQFVKRAGKLRIGAAGDPCCCSGVTTYVQARQCSDDTLVDVWMTSSDAAMFPGAFVILYLSGGLYFSGDVGTPGTIYTASEAIAFTDCASIVGNCGSQVCDTGGFGAVDLSGLFNVGGCGSILVGTAPTSQPLTFVDDGSHCFSNFIIGVYLDAGGGNTVATNIRFNTIGIISPDGLRTCNYYGIQIGEAVGVGFSQILYLGPLVNGAGTRSGRYYWWQDGTSSTFDPVTGYATNGCTRGNVPPFFDVP